MTTLYAKLTQRGERGFTLIELLVVIAIIAILAALVLAALTSAQKGGRDSRRKSDLNQYKTALAQFNADTGTYPGSAGGNVVAAAAAPCSSANWGNYMSTCLVDPQNGSADAGSNVNANHAYVYISSGTNQFGVCVRLERNNGNMFRVTPTISQEVAQVACTEGS